MSDTGARRDSTATTLSGRWKDVRWKMSYDLAVGSLDDGPRATYSGHAWVRLEEGPINDELYQELIWWCDQASAR